MTALDLDDVRTRLAVAAADAAKALEEASQVARVVINDELRGQFTDAGLVTMKERLRVLRHALHDLENVHAELRRVRMRSWDTPRHRRPRRHRPSPRATADDAAAMTRSCRCAFACVARGDGARWVSGPQGPSAAMAGSTSVRVSRRRPP